jgi:low temperature requirement protein LtrA
MVAGIVIFAFGVKVTLAHVHAHLWSLPAVALTGGVALYLVALSGLKRRNIGSWNNPRLVAAAVLAVVAPVATQLPALASLSLVAAVACGLVAYETWRYAEARDRIRHAET